MLNANEIKMIADAIEMKKAALKRAANTEKSEAVKAIRQQEESEYHTLQMKITTKELFNETPISKQKQ